MATFSWKQRLMFIPPLLLGGILIVLAPAMKAEPPKTDPKLNKKVVRVLKMIPRNIQPTVIGYGHTAPEHEWEAQSELSGSVIWVSDKLKSGALVKQNEPLLKLDPSSYELTIAELEAELEVARLKDKTINASLAIAEQDYQLQKAEAGRIARLSTTGHVSGTEKDKALRDQLNSEQQRQTLTNNLAINKAEQRVLISRLNLARRDLELTTIRAPFDCRITETRTGLADYVSKGTSLLLADSIDSVEISAQFPIGKMRPLHRATENTTTDDLAHSNLEALVDLKAGDNTIRWQGKVNRSGGRLDAQTQSQTIIVTVEKPYEQAVPGHRPPLVRDTFVQVTLRAPALKKQMLVPVNALHNDQVYLVSNDGRLEKRPVTVDFIQGQIAVIRSGLASGDIVILSQLASAVEGMELKPQPDKKIAQWLNEVTGYTAPASGKSGADKQGDR